MPGRHFKVLFDIQRIFGQFGLIKQSGIRISLILSVLLVMLFYRSRNIHSYFSRQFGKLTDTDGGENPYYDLLGNEYICWRSILYLFAKRYLSLSGRTSGHSGKIRALISDDSVTEKRRRFRHYTDFPPHSGESSSGKTGTRIAQGTNGNRKLT